MAAVALGRRCAKRLEVVGSYGAVSHAVGHVALLAADAELGPTCVREFWAWAIAHTNKRARAKRRDGSPAVQTALTFYEAATLRPSGATTSPESPCTSHLGGKGSP